MSRKTLIPIMILALASLSATSSAHESAIDQEQSRKPEQEAQQVAETWLTVIDSGDYEKILEQTAACFMEMITGEQRTQSPSTERKNLGNVIERELNAVRFTGTLPDMPDGEYVVVQFSTDFEEKKQTTETVTLIREEDDVWRVGGYSVS